jgi:membrane protease YdiL (CAAX protease family)
LSDEIPHEQDDFQATLPPSASAPGLPERLNGVPPGLPVATADKEGGGPGIARQRLVAVVELILCSSIPTQILLQGLMIGLGWKPRTEDGGLSLSFVVTMSLADTVVLIALMVALTRARGESVSALWLGQRSVWKEALLGVSLVPSIFLMVVVILTSLRLFAPVLHNVETNPLEEMATGGMMNAAAFGVVGILAGGVREELQRAFMLRRFEYFGGVNVGVVVLSIAFGLGHVVQGWDAAVTTGALGFVWAVMYLWRRSSIAPIVSHAGFNSIEVLRIAIAGG